MIDFVAIDFETANQHRTSACSVGIVIVRNGIIVDRIYQLIRPFPNFYTYWATDCHGLSFRDTYNAPEFPIVWAAIAQQIGSTVGGTQQSVRRRLPAGRTRSISHTLS